MCVGCGSGRLIGHGRIEQVIRDMPTHGKRVAIYVDTRRWCCADCGKTFMEALPAVNAKREMTERLCQWIGQQSLKRTFASIADDTGLDEKTIRNIFRDYVSYSFEALRAKILFTEGAHKKTLARPKFQRKRDPVVMDPRPTTRWATVCQVRQWKGWPGWWSGRQKRRLKHTRRASPPRITGPT